MRLGAAARSAELAAVCAAVVLAALLGGADAQYVPCPLDPNAMTCLEPNCIWGDGLIAGQSVKGTVRIGFIGDTGVNANSQSVFQLLRDERVDAVVFGGDLGYEEGNSSALLAQIRQAWKGTTLPPFFVAQGNHDDNKDWSDSETADFGFQLASKSRACYGYTTAGMTCVFRGITFAIVGPGLMGPLPGEYVRWAFATYPSQWRVCVFHMNQQLFQGSTDHLDQTGWDVYETCRRAGAIVATAHDHSYERTFGMRSFRPPVMVSSDPAAPIDIVGGEQGTSMVLVTGTGGEPLRQAGSEWTAKDYWASALTTSSVPPLLHGALLCDFIGADAYCAMKQARDLAVRDYFHMRTLNPPTAVYEPVLTHPPSVQISDVGQAVVMKASGAVSCATDGVDIAKAGSTLFLQFDTTRLAMQAGGEAALLFVPKTPDSQPASYNLSVEIDASGLLSGTPLRCAADSVARNWSREVTVTVAPWDDIITPFRQNITALLREASGAAAAGANGYTLPPALLTLRLRGLSKPGSRAIYVLSGNPCYAPVLEVTLPLPPPPPKPVPPPPATPLFAALWPLWVVLAMAVAAGIGAYVYYYRPGAERAARQFQALEETAALEPVVERDLVGDFMGPGAGVAMQPLNLRELVSRPVNA